MLKKTGTNDIIIGHICDVGDAHHHPSSVPGELMVLYMSRHKWDESINVYLCVNAEGRFEVILEYMFDGKLEIEHTDGTLSQAARVFESVTNLTPAAV